MTVWNCTISWGLGDHWRTSAHNLDCQSFKHNLIIAGHSEIIFHFTLIWKNLIPFSHLNSAAEESFKIKLRFCYFQKMKNKLWLCLRSKSLFIERFLKCFFLTLHTIVFIKIVCYVLLTFMEDVCETAQTRGKTHVSKEKQLWAITVHTNSTKKKLKIDAARWGLVKKPPPVHFNGLSPLSRSYSMSSAEQGLPSWDSGGQKGEIHGEWLLQLLLRSWTEGVCVSMLRVLLLR